MNPPSISTPLRPQAVVPNDSRAAEMAAIDALRWWRVPMVWVVIAGPLAVVIASLLTAVIAWRYIDPVIVDAGSGLVVGRAGDDVAAAADPRDPLAPALRARNHTAEPRD
ncbi:nitrogen fixation protein FixH [Piscinibacter sakaiensis]|uniref:nitrogen fixation protein FixH n=1 Tax=Piscinibacter sakaiensis TaxID=1547922 RepID=UPI003AAC1E9A